MAERVLPLALASAAAVLIAACSARTPEPAPSPASTPAAAPAAAPATGAPVLPVRAVPGERLIFAESAQGARSLRPGDIPPERLAEVVPRIARLRVVPAALALRPGDSLDLRDALRVIALDFDGRALGSLPQFDRRFPGGSTVVRASLPHRIVGVAEGEASVTVSVPRAHWTGDADARPSATVPVRVSRDAPPSAMLRNPLTEMLGSGRGGGYSSCDVRERPIGLPGRVPFRAPPTADIDCAQVEARETVGGTERRWVRAFVLTRNPDPSIAMRPMPDPFDRRAAQAASDSVFDAMRRLQREAQERGRIHIGGGITNGVLQEGFELSQGFDTIFVAGRVLEIPWSDSTLVVLVDRDRGTAGPTVARHLIKVELPDAYWPKQWMNGDTTFFVRPSRAPTLLRAALSGIPGIERFLP